MQQFFFFSRQKNCEYSAIFKGFMLQKKWKRANKMVYFISSSFLSISSLAY